MFLKRLHLVFVSATFLIPALFTAQQAPPVHVTIVVIDASGAIVANAQVQVVPLAAPDPKMKTNDRGELAVDLNPGGYELSVNSPGFKQFSKRIDVSAAKPQQTLPITLQIANIGGMVVYGDGLQLWSTSSPDPVTLTIADLKALPHLAVTIRNSHTNADETYAGVRLADLFTRAKLGALLGDALRGKALSGYIIATGVDGYQALFALAEIDPSFHPGEVLVADAMNGHPLDSHNGPFKLVATEDKRPARSVRNLVTLKLKLATDN